MKKEPNSLSHLTRNRRFLFILVAPLTLLLAAPAMAGSGGETPTVADPEWCNCERLDTASSEEERVHMLDQIRLDQSICWQEMGVLPTHPRKGQGAGLDACACECLNEGAEPVERPWGDKKKPAKPGQGNQSPAREDQP